MKNNTWIIGILVGFSILISTHRSIAHTDEETHLWPEIEPFHTGYLKVSELHQIYYELCGNPQGKAVFVLHGGPGGRCSPYMRRFFNPQKFLIVLHDQRGAGKSKPYAEIRENTTQNLIEDIEQLRKHLKVDKMILFGGSWGTTLGLAYAETYPDNVNGLVLRGVFTATQKEIDHFYHGGIKPFFPKLYAEFLSALPKSDRDPIYRILSKHLQSQDLNAKEKYTKLWAWYELKISQLIVSDDWVKGVLESGGILDRFYAFSLLENHYMDKGCFLEEGQLLQNTNKIRHVPTIIINGRYDMICPPLTAYRLHQKLPQSELIIVEGAGHWMGEKSTEKALLKAMISFE
jgi:proline iminopeptidase